MQFNPDALAAKVEYLDRILADQGLLSSAVTQLVGGTPQLTLRQRPWQPGGGSTLFEVGAGEHRYFLKVKSEKVLVESKLESEAGFSDRSGLQSEYAMIARLSGLGLKWVASSARFVRQGGFDFLLMEYLETFEEASANYSLLDWIASFQQVADAARWLFDHDLVHTDIHEFNIRVRPRTGEMVLVDFEEAKFLPQDTSFNESLDCVGHNQYGDVGEVPTTAEHIGGYSCLERLHQVYCKRMQPQLFELIKRSNFDSSCPFLTTLDHGTDPRIYQSLSIDGISIEGQRPLADQRPEQIREIVTRLFSGPVVHMDIGANIGAFNLALSGHAEIRRTIGIEAFANYVELAKVQAFYRRDTKAEFFCAECGEVSIADLVREPVDIVTIYSVYHHIRNRRRFLEDLLRLSPKVIMLELATQPECYEGRTWQETLAEIQTIVGLPYVELIGTSADYKRPVVLISSTPLDGTKLRSHSVASNNTVKRLAQPVQGKVSIVLPCDDLSKLLPRAVNAILAQTYRDFELIIVHVGSTTGIKAWLDGLNDHRVRVITQTNAGLAAALNAGFKSATGQFMTWTDADSITHPEFLARLVMVLAARPDAGMVVAGHLALDGQERILRAHCDQDTSPLSLLCANPGIAAFIYRRDLKAAEAGYDQDLDGAEDWDMWVRISEEAPVVALPDIVYSHRLHADPPNKKPQIDAAKRKLVSRALLRQGTLRPEVYLPGVVSADGGKEVEGLAYWEMAQRLYASPFAPEKLALQLFQQAAKRLSTPELFHGMLLAAYKAGDLQMVVEAIHRIAGTGDIARANRLAEGAKRGILSEQDLAISAPPQLTDFAQRLSRIPIKMTDSTT